jgi:integrase
MTTKRRGHNEGSIYFQLEKNSWRAMVTVDGHRLSHSAKTRQECQAWLKEMSKKVDNGLTYKATKITVNEYLEDWLISTKNNLRFTSHNQYKMTIHVHVLPYLGKVLLTDLRVDLIQKFYNKKIESGTGIPTISMINNILHRAFKQAVVLRIINYNPTDGVIIPRSTQNKEMKFLDESQSNYLLSIVKGTRFDALYQLELSTGLRESELLGLRWSDIDWRNKTISISRQLVHDPRLQPELFGPLKTSSAYRTIYLGDQTIEKLHEHFNAQGEERRIAEKKNKWTDFDLIFPSLVGTPMRQVNLYNNFKRILRSSGLPDIRFHDLRHTAATLMLNHNIPVIVVSKRLGHARVTITLNVYAHLIPESQKNVGQLMDDLISPIEVDSKLFCTPFEIP